MNQTILVPLDGSAEAEKVLVLAQRFLPPGGRGILLRGSPGNRKKPETGTVASMRQDLLAALGYLRCVVGHLVDAQGRWRCAVVVADSVAQGIADFAARGGGGPYSNVHPGPKRFSQANSGQHH